MLDFSRLTDIELVNLAKTDNNALSYVFKKYDKMLKSICRQFYLVSGDNDDLLQEGMIGLFNAINTYNAKNQFSTYAYRCIKNSVLTAINKSNCNKNKPLNNFISLSGTDDDDVDKNLFFSDLKHNPEETFIKQEAEIELVNKIKDTLSKLEGEILDLYLKGYSYQDIAEKSNKNAKSIDNAIQRIRKKLKSIL